MKNIFLLSMAFYFVSQLNFCQTILEADGPGETYELINSVFAPGYNAVETPDCNHNDYGRHIDEVFDKELNKNVFRFHIHTTPDNDRCKKFDRQRNEIKAYKQSPDNLLALENEEIEYKWKFKLDKDFQPSSSFTHIHQIKAVGGSEASMPLFTLTVRKGNPDKLELRYAKNKSQISLGKVSLESLKGQWVEVTETILFDDEKGKYEIKITNVKTGKTIFKYKKKNIRTWKTDALFLRPKWGIYRSLKKSSDLRDEQLLYADFSITELKSKK